MSIRILKKINIFWSMFIGIGAVWGAFCMVVIDPSGEGWTGMGAFLPYLQKLPLSDVLFQDLVFAGIALLIVNGFTQLTAAVLLLKNHYLASRFTALCGIILMLWVCIQLVIMPNPVSVAYLIFGLIEAITGWLQYKTERNKTGIELQK